MLHKRLLTIGKAAPIGGSPGGDVSQVLSPTVVRTDRGNRTTYVSNQSFSVSGGLDSCLVVMVALQGNSGQTDPDQIEILYNGQPCVLARTDGLVNGSSSTGQSHIAYLLNPAASSSGVITVNTFNSGGVAELGRAAVIVVAELSGVDAASPIGFAGGVGDLEVPQDLAVTFSPTRANSYVFCVAAHRGSSGTTMSPIGDTSQLFAGETGTTSLSDVVYLFGKHKTVSTSPITIGTTKTGADGTYGAVSVVEFRPPA